MNHFILDENLEQSVEYHVDAHIVKMGIEATQMCSTALYQQFGLSMGYSPVYQSHPLVKWTGYSRQNWMWMAAYGMAIFREYTHRFGREHASQVVLEGMIQYVAQLDTRSWNVGLTPHHLAVAPEMKGLDPVDAYRAYYLKYKTRLFKWTNREIPFWIPGG